jgi:hypothetical protein
MSAEPTGRSVRGVRAGSISTGLMLALAAASLVLVALDFVVERHPHFEPESWPGFYALCGAAACLAAVLLALLLRRIVLRPEGYHDR